MWHLQPPLHSSLRHHSFNFTNSPPPLIHHPCHTHLNIFHRVFDTTTKPHISPLSSGLRMYHDHHNTNTPYLLLQNNPKNYTFFFLKTSSFLSAQHYWPSPSQNSTFFLLQTTTRQARTTTTRLSNAIPLFRLASILRRGQLTIF